MLRILIVDDEPLAHEVVITYINECQGLQLVGQCYSGSQALAFVKENPVDLIMLDIEMPVLTGFDFLSLLPEKPQVVITSAYQEYALEGFNMDVTDYLLKPFRFDRFKQAIDKVKQHIQQAPQRQIKAPEVNDLADNQNIFIKVDRKQVHINLAEISCFEAYGNYVKVWRNQQALLTPKTLTSFEQSLPASQFVRVHKSAIVNYQMIDYVEGDSLKLTDGKMVAIGKQYKANLVLD
ncbi:LytR/AlgR family response regulator transcription factor [Thalassomonas actiniarum]|uniref:Response regulator transcription factor n=1 Tax=Thalassomonas actiniarum TaxID=485447 RepID=A0AAE9YXS7_9GAMM|nr:LytTR family DNA-binding domain-containing protein [Thalassomonas actiniarum]WDE02329.1 response regulator transcription factor [Thalassomonas actiniarum]